MTAKTIQIDVSPFCDRGQAPECEHYHYTGPSLFCECHRSIGHFHRLGGKGEHEDVRACPCGRVYVIEACPECVAWGGGS